MIYQLGDICVSRMCVKASRELKFNQISVYKICLHATHRYMHVVVQVEVPARVFAQQGCAPQEAQMTSARVRGGCPDEGCFLLFSGSMTIFRGTRISSHGISTSSPGAQVMSSLGGRITIGLSKARSPQGISTEESQASGSSSVLRRVSVMSRSCHGSVMMPVESLFSVSTASTSASGASSSRSAVKVTSGRILMPDTGRAMSLQGNSILESQSTDSSENSRRRVCI